MKKYVICLVRAKDTGKIIFVRKNRPEWQKGRINLIGGKVEPGEFPSEAVAREVYEETGIYVNYGDLLGKIVDEDKDGPYEVWCYKTEIEKEYIISGAPNEDEEFFWADWRWYRGDEKLIQNLRTVIPLMLSGESNWTVYTTKYNPYTVEVSYDAPQG